MFCVFIDFLPLYLFVLKTNRFYNVNEPTKHFFIMLRTYQYSAIEVGVVLTLRITLICPNVIHER